MFLSASVCVCVRPCGVMCDHLAVKGVVDPPYLFAHQFGKRVAGVVGKRLHEVLREERGVRAIRSICLLLRLSQVYTKSSKNTRLQTESSVTPQPQLSKILKKRNKML